MNTQQPPNGSPTAGTQRHIPSPTTGLCLLAALILCVLSLLTVYWEINRVDSVTLRAGSYVSEEEVKTIVGRPQGDFFPAVNTSKMEKHIRALSPMVADVTFQIRFPRRLYVTVIDEIYAYYLTAADGRVLLLNRDFKLLAIHDADGAGDVSLCDLTELYVQEPSQAQLGDTLDFAHKEELAQFLSVLRKAKGVYYQQLNVLDLRNPRNLTVVFDGLVRMELSEHTDLPAKLASLAQIMEKLNTRQEGVPICLTFVRPARKEEPPHWAVESNWADIYKGYTSPQE